MDLKVKDPRGFRFGGKFYAQGQIIPGAREREGNLLVALGKADVYVEPEPKKAKKAKKGDYETRHMQAE